MWVLTVTGNRHSGDVTRRCPVERRAAASDGETTGPNYRAVTTLTFKFKFIRGMYNHTSPSLKMFSGKSLVLTTNL